MRSLGAINAASADVALGVPAELLHEYVDKGLSPDAFTAEMGRRATEGVDAMARKQAAMRSLADQVRSEAAGLFDS